MPNETLDRFLSSVGEMMLTSSRLRTAADEVGLANVSAPVTQGFDQMDRSVGELKRRAMELRTTPLLRVVENLPRIARDVADARGKRVELEYSGSELALDRSILDRLYDPLVHLVRNAADHGIEDPDARAAAGKEIKGRIEVVASREGDSIRIEIRDDGKGIDLHAVRERAVAAGLIHPDLAVDLPDDEIADFIFARVSRPPKRSPKSRAAAWEWMRSAQPSNPWVARCGFIPNSGPAPAPRSSFRSPPPCSVCCSRVWVPGTLAFPIGKVEHIIEVDAEDVEQSAAESFVSIDGEPVHVIDVAAAVGWTQAPSEADTADPTIATLLLGEVRGERVALRVDALAGHQELYVKPLPRILSNLSVLSGLTVLGNGEPVFLVDSNQLQ